MEGKVFRGYSEAELRAAFEAVEDKANWKHPIVSATVIEAAIDVTRAAIEFYAGSDALFTPKSGSDLWDVTAPGYYLSVGA